MVTHVYKILLFQKVTFPLAGNVWPYHKGYDSNLRGISGVRNLATPTCLWHARETNMICIVVKENCQNGFLSGHLSLSRSKPDFLLQT